MAGQTSPQRAGLTREEGVARIRLIRSSGIGPITYRQLLARFGSAVSALEGLPDLPGKSAFKPFSVKAVEAEMAAVRAAGGRYLFHDGADYPALLDLAEGAPPILIVRGDPAIAARRPVAIVGARNASAGAMKLARGLARDLAAEGCAVISGLARGVDAAAHEGALSADSGAGAACRGCAGAAHRLSGCAPHAFARAEAGGAAAGRCR